MDPPLVNFGVPTAASRLGRFNARSTRDIAVVFGAGWLLLALMLAQAFGEVFAGQ